LDAADCAEARRAAQVLRGKTPSPGALGSKNVVVGDDCLQPSPRGSDRRRCWSDAEISRKGRNA
jgi:hypothetical protein